MKGVFIAKLDVEETKEMHSDPGLYNRRYAVTSVHTYHKQGYGTVTLKEIASMEKQPEYEFVNVKPTAKEFACELIDGGVLYNKSKDIELYFDEFSGKFKGRHYDRDLGIATSEGWDIVVESRDYYRRVEITPEVKREREVEELANYLVAIYNNCMGREETLHLEGAKKLSESALKWMESKK